MAAWQISTLGRICMEELHKDRFYQLVFGAVLSECDQLPRYLDLMRSEPDDTERLIKMSVPIGDSILSESDPRAWSLVATLTPVLELQAEETLCKIFREPERARRVHEKIGVLLRALPL